MRLSAAVLLLAALALPTLAQQQHGIFEVVYLPVHGRRQDTVVYDFTGDGANDVLNTSIDYDVDPPVRWMALHVGAKGRLWRPAPDFIWSVHATASALQFGNFVPEGGVEICTVAPDGVYYYPFENGKIVEEPRKLVHARTFFSQPTPRALPIWGFAQDLSGDGRDDLILPTPDGYRVYFQTEPGRFGKISRLESDAKALAVQRFPQSLEFVASLFNLNVRLPRVAVADIDGDRRLDLVTVTDNVINYHFQLEANEYRTGRKWSARYVVKALEEEVKKDSISYMLVAFADVDADGTPDLVVTKIEGEAGLFESLRTRIDVHFGSNNRGNYESNLFIKIHGVSIDPHFIDMNGDGKLDCLVSRFRTDILSRGAEIFVAGDIPVDYEAFKFDAAKQSFGDSPSYEYSVYVRLEDIEKKGAASRPLLYVPGDLTGDGRPDQVRVVPKTDTIEVHPGRGGLERIDFDPTAHHELKLERYPKGLQFYDVNGDGLIDMILHHAGSVGFVVTRRR